MIEIWTEDSTSGYIIIQNIIRSIYGNNFIKVKPHDGNSDDTPKCGSNGGILYDLVRNRNNNNIIIIIVDMALDNTDVMYDLEIIDNELEMFHSKYHILTGLYCFEYGMLSYKNLKDYGGTCGLQVLNDISNFTQAILDNRFCADRLKRYDNGYFSRQNKIEEKTGEVIAKALLGLATNRTNIYLNKREIHGAIIQNGRVGA